MTSSPLRTCVRMVQTAVAAATLVAGPALAQQPFVMKLSTPTVNDVTHEWMKQFKAGAEARAKGKLKVEIYPANQLGSVPRTVEGVALGTVELTFVSAGYFANYDVRYEAVETVGLFDNIGHANRVLMDPEVRKRIATWGAAKGVEPLLCAANGPLAVSSLKPLRGVDDFKGMKIRTPGTTPLQVNPMRQMGASPVAMPIGEGLPSMQNKTIDAVMASPVIFLGFKYYDVTKFMTFLPKNYLMACAVTNKAFLQSLGPELEQVVREEALKAQQIFLTRSQAETDAGRKTWEQNGGEVIEFSPAESQRYIETVNSVNAKTLGSSMLKPDLDLLTATAQRLK